MKRGLWLIFIELVIVCFAWSFNPAYEPYPLGVIWSIGVSMFILGLLIRLPYNVFLGLGFLIVFEHNSLNFPEAATGYNGRFLLDLLRSSKWTLHQIIGNHNLIIAYPFLPWLGLIILGYCAGKLFSPQFYMSKKKKTFNPNGNWFTNFIRDFCGINVYCNPEDWSQQQNGLYTFFSFMKIQKYRITLHLCVTIGYALILLPYLEKLENRFTKIMVIFGRTAFFYYILHVKFHQQCYQTLQRVSKIFTKHELLDFQNLFFIHRLNYDD